MGNDFETENDDPVPVLINKLEKTDLEFYSTAPQPGASNLNKSKKTSYKDFQIKKGTGHRRVILQQRKHSTTPNSTQNQHS